MEAKLKTPDHDFTQRRREKRGFMTASGIGEIPTSAAADLLLQVVSTPVSVPSQTYINSASKRPKAPEIFSRKFQEPGKVTPELC